MVRHVTTVKQFYDKQLLKSLFDKSSEFKKTPAPQLPPLLADKIIATLFYEPSTRTRLSFEVAIQRLGGAVVTTENAGEFSSAIKGETLEDSIRIVSGYCDGMVLRHPMRGAAKLAAQYSDVPVINAGDGDGEHPTQALLDLFTVYENKSLDRHLKVALVGDLFYGRTVHSLSHLLSMYDIELFFVAPDALQMPESYTGFLKEHNLKINTLNKLEDAIGELDVIYMTRIQKERFATTEDYEKHKNSFVLDKKLMSKAKKDAIVLHPLPRVSEISPEIDSDPRSLYFKQAENGLYVRMALLEYIYSKENKGA